MTPKKLLGLPTRIFGVVDEEGNLTVTEQVSNLAMLGKETLFPVGVYALVNTVTATVEVDVNPADEELLYESMKKHEELAGYASVEEYFQEYADYMRGMQNGD